MTLRSLVFITLLTTLISLTQAQVTPPDTLNNSFIGICSQITRETGDHAPFEQRDILLQMIQNADLGATRTGFKWKVIHPAPGEWDWRIADAVVHSARESKVEILALVGGMPPSAAADPLESLPLWVEFVDSLTKRYTRDIQTWELWNEPNVRAGKYWPQQALPGPFVKYIKAAARTIRSNQPDATILLGGIATGKKADPFGFWESVFALGILEDLDGVAYHPYHQVSLNLLPFNQRLEDLIKKHSPDASKELWITEFGIPAVDVPGAGKFSQGSQRLEMMKTAVTHWATGGDRFFIYALQDKEHLDSGLDKKELRSKRKSYFGLLEKDRTPKQSFDALSWLTPWLSLYEPLNFEVMEKGLWVHAQHRENGEDMYVTFGAAAFQKAQADAGSFELTQLHAQSMDLNVSDLDNGVVRRLKNEIVIWK